jgi:beta-aspartyl-peptidase (threonine type)
MYRAVLVNCEGVAGISAAVNALRNNASPLDAVEIGIRIVERDPTVRSVGFGGAPNLRGEAEFDAAIMEGTTLRAGAVAALKGYRSPISVARQVMERTPHVLLAGDGAARFAAEIGADSGDMLSPEAARDYRDWVAEHTASDDRQRWPDMPLVEYAWMAAKGPGSRGANRFPIAKGRGGHPLPQARPQRTPAAAGRPPRKRPVPRTRPSRGQSSPSDPRWRGG